MQYSQAQLGRVFVVRLEDGDIVDESIEQLARQEGIRSASLIAVGGADAGSRLVVGPEEGRAETIRPMTHVLDNVREIAGTGTLFPDESSGEPVLHMHMACGRQSATVTGCVRAGVRVWQVMEVIVYELLGTAARRAHDPQTGFALLQP